MKKAKVRTETTKARVASPVKSAGREAPDLAEIRRHIADIVGNSAVGMVETTIDQVGKGHYLGMKYLFEMIGLYPAIRDERRGRRRFAGGGAATEAGSSRSADRETRSYQRFRGLCCGG